MSSIVHVLIFESLDKHRVIDVLENALPVQNVNIFYYAVSDDIFRHVIDVLKRCKRMESDSQRVDADD